MTLTVFGRQTDGKENKHYVGQNQSLEMFGFSLSNSVSWVTPRVLSILALHIDEFNGMILWTKFGSRAITWRTLGQRYKDVPVDYLYEDACGVSQSCR